MIWFYVYTRIPFIILSVFLLKYKKPYKFRIKLPGVPGAQASKEVPKPKPKIQSPPDEYLACIIREVAVTGHHVAGTCAGGKVVDDQLRYVYNTIEKNYLSSYNFYRSWNFKTIHLLENDIKWLIIGIQST